MTEINPFAAPLSECAPGSDRSIEGEVWRAGKMLVFTHGASLPERCIKCNSTDDLTMKPRTLYYYPQWVLLLILVNLLVLLIVAMAVRKTSTASLAVCAACRRRRRNAILLSWLCVFAGLGFFASMIFSDIIWPQNPNLVVGLAIMSSIALFLTAIVIALVRGQLLTVRKIDKQQVRLSRIASAYLDMLPVGP